MPITCPVHFPRLSTDEFAALDYQLMAHAFASQKALGRLADEPVYQADFAVRLLAAGFAVQREVPITATFRTFSKTYFLDVVVNEKAIYELKAVAKLTPEHSAQLMNYLLMLDCSRGKVVNFRPNSVESRFVNAPLTTADRRSFDVYDAQWRGDGGICVWIMELLRDWGTALELPLYHHAVVHLLGGEEIVTRLLPMQRDGVPLGNQRFHLMEPDAAFRITALDEASSNYETQLKRLLAHSPLRTIHWINISHHHVTLTTIGRE